MSHQDLLSLDNSGFHLRALDAEGLMELHGGLLYESPDTAVRLIRGTVSSSLEGFMNEASAALQFPTYFGGNWSGFEDLFAGLDWLHASAFVFIFTDALQLLADSPADFDVLCTVLKDAHQKRTSPREDEPEFRPTPFSVVGICAPDEEISLRDRLRRSNIDIP